MTCVRFRPSRASRNSGLSMALTSPLRSINGASGNKSAMCLNSGPLGPRNQQSEPISLIVCLHILTCLHRRGQDHGQVEGFGNLSVDLQLLEEVVGLVVPNCMEQANLVINNGQGLEMSDGQQASDCSGHTALFLSSLSYVKDPLAKADIASADAPRANFTKEFIIVTNGVL